MIVRDEEENIQHCLGSAADLFDETVVVDTGSTDRSVEIARKFGARVFDFVWVDDFTAARKAELARATGDYAKRVTLRPLGATGPIVSAEASLPARQASSQFTPAGCATP
jgi:hypothetical protein